MFLVCKAAKADLVFLVDGSWSIGDDNFNKIIGFLYSTVGALDKIGPDGTQVSVGENSCEWIHCINVCVVWLSEIWNNINQIITL